MLTFVSCTKEQSADEFIAELVRDTEIDLSKINRDVVVPGEAEKAIRSYKGNIPAIWDDIDSLLEVFPDSYDLKALKIQFLQRTDRKALGDYIDSFYMKDSLNSQNQFLYGTSLEPGKGKDYFVGMIKKKKNDPFGYLGLAFSVLYSGEQDMQIPAKLLYLSILKDPSIDDSFELLGHIFYSLERSDDMAVLNGIMLVKDPSNTIAFENLSYYYISTGQKKKAAELLEAFNKNNPGLLSSSYIADYYFGLGEYDKTSQFLKSARDGREKDTYLDFTEARMKVVSGQTDEGVKFLEKYAAANSADRDLSYRLTDAVFAEKLFGNQKYYKLLKKYENGSPTIGDKAPPLSGVYLSGLAHTDSVLQGKVYMIDFWAEWCSPCKNVMPDVISVYEEFSKRGFTVIGVNLDNEGQKDNALNYISENSIKWDHIHSGKGWTDENVSLYKVQGIPSTFLVDSKGVIRYKNLRGKDLTAEKIGQLLDEKTQSEGMK